MSRHPYTNAADFIRTINFGGIEDPKLSRAQAAAIRQAIADAIGMDDSDLACKLSERFQADEDKAARTLQGLFSELRGMRKAP